jgi:hypothetical protein
MEHSIILSLFLQIVKKLKAAHQLQQRSFQKENSFTELLTAVF